MAYTPKPEQLQKYYQVVSDVEGGETSLKKALSRAHLGHESFDRINDYLAGSDATKRLVRKTPQYRTSTSGPAHRIGVTYQVEARHFHLLTSSGQIVQDVPLDARNASLMGTYWNAVDSAFEGKVGLLQTFQLVTIRDIHGQVYHLLTDVNAIRTVLGRMTEAEQREFFATIYLEGAGRSAAA